MTAKGDSLFCAKLDRSDGMKMFSRRVNGFGSSDRFSYEIRERKLMACQKNLGPTSYNVTQSFNKLVQIPCNANMVSSS